MNSLDCSIVEWINVTVYIDRARVDCCYLLVVDQIEFHKQTAVAVYQPCQPHLQVDRDFHVCLLDVVVKLGDSE